MPATGAGTEARLGRILNPCILRPPVAEKSCFPCWRGGAPTPPPPPGPQASLEVSEGGGGFCSGWALARAAAGVVVRLAPPDLTGSQGTNDEWRSSTIETVYVRDWSPNRERRGTSELLFEPSGSGLLLHIPQRCRVLFLAPYPVPTTGRAGKGEGWALPTSLASCPVPASSLGVLQSSASQADLISGERAKPARQSQRSKQSLPLPCFLALGRVRYPRSCSWVKTTLPACPPVWKPHNPGIPVTSQLVSSDITFPKGWYHWRLFCPLFGP